MTVVLFISTRQTFVLVSHPGPYTVNTVSDCPDEITPLSGPDLQWAVEPGVVIPAGAGVS